MFFRKKKQVTSAEKKQVTSAEGIELIKSFEGFRSDAYLCAAGVWTCGWGSTKGVQEGDVWSESHAEERLATDVEEFEDAVRELVTVKLNDDQFSALVSFCFNLGANALKISTLLKKLNAGDYQAVPDQIRRWNKATVNGEKVVLDGLVRRRNAEALLFQSKDWRHI